MKEQGRYSYEKLIKKPDMAITIIDEKYYKTLGLTRSDIVNNAMDNAEKNGYINEKGNAVIHAADISRDVIITPRSLRHGLDRRINVIGHVTEKIGESALFQGRDYSVEPEDYTDLFDDLFTDDGDLPFGEEPDARRAESIIDKMIEYDAEGAAYFLSYSAGEIAQNTLNGLPYLKENRDELLDALKNGRYKPQAVHKKILNFFKCPVFCPLFVLFCLLYCSHKRKTKTKQNQTKQVKEFLS